MGLLESFKNLFRSREEALVTPKVIMHPSTASSINKKKEEEIASRAQEAERKEQLASGLRNLAAGIAPNRNFEKPTTAIAIAPIRHKLNLSKGSEDMGRSKQQKAAKTKEPDSYYEVLYRDKEANNNIDLYFVIKTEGHKFAYFIEKEMEILYGSKVSILSFMLTDKATYERFIKLEEALG